MPGYVLTTTSQVKCTHGGTAILTTTNVMLKIDGAPALLETDIHPVIGCPFTVGLKPQPCIRIEWSAGATMCKSSGTNILVQSSIGKCISAEGAIQGIAIIAQTQMKAKAI
jgi:hypothetical protein